MKILIALILCLFGGVRIDPAPQQNAAKTEVPYAGPCTNFPDRYQKLEERLAWFYGCMHKNPPTIAEVQAKIAALPPERRAVLKSKDFATREALLGVAFYELPIQVFPK
jgi:hypothetical protein